MNRLYMAECGFSLTGGMADHRLRSKVGDIGAIALALAKELNVSGAELKVVGNGSDKAKKFVSVLANDLAAHKGRSIVIAGPRQPAQVHALVFAQLAGQPGDARTPITSLLPSLAGYVKRGP